MNNPGLKQNNPTPYSKTCCELNKFHTEKSEVDYLYSYQFKVLITSCNALKTSYNHYYEGYKLDIHHSHLL